MKTVCLPPGLIGVRSSWILLLRGRSCIAGREEKGHDEETEEEEEEEKRERETLVNSDISEGWHHHTDWTCTGC